MLRSAVGRSRPRRPSAGRRLAAALGTGSSVVSGPSTRSAWTASVGVVGRWRPRVAVVAPRRPSPRRPRSAAVGAGGCRDQVVEVDRLAVTSVTAALSSTTARPLRRATSATICGHLAGLVDGLGEVVGVHAVLLGAGDQVLDQLPLADRDLLLARRSRRAANWARRPCGPPRSPRRGARRPRAGPRPPGGGAPRPRRRLRHRDLDGGEQGLQQPLAGLDALLERAWSARPGSRRSARSSSRVSNSLGQLGELVVRRRAARAP